VASVGVGASNTNNTYTQYNFPNPFNLQPKTVTLRTGSAGVNANITGTYIVLALAGDGVSTAGVTIRIYNAAGDMVRAISDIATLGRYNYFEWDGKSTSGDNVASGVYFASVDAPGAPKKTPIKMVLVK
jgi:flagellar hook assembly protein FlgD